MSTASTLPFAYVDEELQDEIRSNPSAIDLASQSDEEIVELYTHFVPTHRQRPPAPFTIISQTNLRDVVSREQAQTNDDATRKIVPHCTTFKTRLDDATLQLGLCAMVIL